MSQDVSFMLSHVSQFSFLAGQCNKNWMQAKMKGVFIAEDPGTSQKPAAHLSPQPQQEKLTKIASQL